MKNNVKLILSISLCITMCIVACKKDYSIVGSWSMTNIRYQRLVDNIQVLDSAATPYPYYYLQLSAQSTFHCQNYVNLDQGSYTYTGGVLKLNGSVIFDKFLVVGLSDHSLNLQPKMDTVSSNPLTVIQSTYNFTR